MTGGAGYIASHVVLLLTELRHEVTSLDNLSSGHDWMVHSGRLVEGDICEYRTVYETFEAYAVEAVIHLAAVSNIQ